MKVYLLIRISSMPPAKHSMPEDLTTEPPPTSAHEASKPRRSNPRHHNPHSHRKRKPSRSPGVEWKEKWTSESFKDGRVLILDYVSRDFTEDGRRRVLANEFHEIDQLRRFYNADAPRRTPALRVIHVQNSWWARRFLLRKFNIDPNDDLVGMSFGKWAAFTSPQRRAGRPMMTGKAFRNQRDPWRGISRCAFGMDYLKYYPPGRCDSNKDVFKMMELQGFDSKGDPQYMNDVYVQRISVYVQKYVSSPIS